MIPQARALGLGMISIGFAEIILAIRAWAVCRCDVKVGLLLGLLQLCNLVVACFSAQRYLHSTEFRSAPYPGFRGCFVKGSGSPIYANFLFLTCLEAVVLCIMIGCAVRAYRLGLVGEFSNVVYRDAIYFYVFLMVVAIANIVVILHLPPSFWTLLQPLQCVLHSVFTSRILINIRMADDRNRKQTTELHTSLPEYLRDCPITWARESGEGREEDLPMGATLVPERGA